MKTETTEAHFANNSMYYIAPTAVANDRAKVVIKEDKHDEEEIVTTKEEPLGFVTTIKEKVPLWIGFAFSISSDLVMFDDQHELELAQCLVEMSCMDSACGSNQLLNRGRFSHLSDLAHAELFLPSLQFPPDQFGLEFPFDPGSSLFTTFLRVTRNCVFCFASSNLVHDNFITSTLWNSCITPLKLQLRNTADAYESITTNYLGKSVLVRIFMCCLSASSVGIVKKLIQIREWSGASELNLVLDKLIGISCKIIEVMSGVPIVGRWKLFVDMIGSKNIDQVGQSGQKTKLKAAEIYQGHITRQSMVLSIPNDDFRIPSKGNKLIMFLLDSFGDAKPRVLLILCTSLDNEGDKEKFYVTTVKDARRFYSLLGFEANVALNFSSRIREYFSTMRSIWDPGVDGLALYLFDPCKELPYIPLGEDTKIKGIAVTEVFCNPMKEHRGAFDPYLNLHKFTSMLSMLLYSNLEDKVLFKDGSIVMNKNSQWAMMKNGFKKLANFVWDPG
ncbi:uncharacterized protein [Nicotiana sylvestris]|uniref:uncharacterized protein n=1 Tax=Nicotiana sylvestris TaxID=4096 RepID=UPI00388C7280